MSWILLPLFLSLPEQPIQLPTTAKPSSNRAENRWFRFYPKKVPDEAIGWEYNNLKAIRIGDHKATWIGKPFGPGEWQIFDLSIDPGESKDLSTQKPKLRQRLIDAYGEYAKSVGVIPPEGGLYDDK